MDNAGVFQLAAAGIFGLLIGSFLNVCIYRVPRDLSIVFPRSFCPQCDKQIGWRHNIPLVSYAVLHGRCASCAARIGVRYPLVELSTALLFALVVARYGWTLAGLKWAIFESLAIVLFWTDMEDRILPDEFTIGGAIAGLAIALFVPLRGPVLEHVLASIGVPWRSLLGAIVGCVLLALPMWAVGAFYRTIRKREGLGLGDVKLLALIGSFLGFESGILALMIGAASGSIIGLGYIWWTRQNASTYQLPFGSFLCLGAAIVPLVSSL